VSSPNEPGHPRAAERPGNANGSTAGGSGSAATGHINESGDVPPWERGVAARANASQDRPPSEPPPARPEAARGGAVPAVDDRLNRFLSGGPAPAHDGAKPHPPARTDAYASELPDLSGPVPRPPQRQAQGDRPATATAAVTGRIQVGNRQRGPVRASMQIRRIDPWSTLKVSLVLSVALFFVWMIAVAFLYLVLGGMGVWSKLNSNVGDLLTSASGGGGELVSSGTIFGGAALIGLVNIVLLSAMATIGAFIYNLITDLVGGIEVTLADRD
jgi:hypothetical protein